MAKPQSKPVSVYTSIERDTRGRWYPVIELRRAGVIVFTVTHYQPHMSAVKCAKRALELVSSINV